MIKKIRIDNFKSLNDFSMDLGKLTVVIGDNAVGKSSLLQALVFLRYSCTSLVDQYLKDRGVSVDSIVSKIQPISKRTVSFEVTFDFDGEIVLWKIAFLSEKKTNSIKLQTESVELCPDCNKPVVLLHYSSSKAFRHHQDSDTDESIPVASYSCSQLQFIDEKAARSFPCLWRIRKFFMDSEPLDLLSPQDMRRSARGNARTLGINGSRLPALINQLNEKERDNLVALIRSDLPNICSIQSIVHGKPGWAHLETIERFGTRDMKIPASGISDGTLRLIALYSLGYIDKNSGMTLLDEVEDGINTNNLENVIKTLKDYVDNRNQQVLVTTHSTVMLDYCNPSDIRYMYRDDRGNTVCRTFNEPEMIKEKLEYLYPGELILNLDACELNQVMAESKSDYGA